MEKKDENVKLFLGNNIEKLRELPDNFVDSIVTDPPYGLSFMNKKWDYDVPSVEFWQEVYRVLKPGGHVLSFGGTRTYHRMVVNMEDAGFEIRDQIMWVYGSGFPKSLNIGKEVDKKLGNEREIIGDNPNHRTSIGKVYELGFRDGREKSTLTKGNGEWEGWGTGLKPANEPICVGRKQGGDINIDIDTKFYYVPKVSKQERNLGLDKFEKQETKGSIGLHSVGGSPTKDNSRVQKNIHPTVKPINLLTYLCRLITPKGGIVMDCFMGSGSTGIAARLEGFQFIGMELDPEYFNIAESRIEQYEDYKKLIKKK